MLGGIWWNCRIGIDRIGGLLLRMGRAIGLQYVLRPLTRIAPSGVQRRLRRWKRNVEARRGYRTKLVPEAQIEEAFHRALAELDERRGDEEIGDYLEFGVCHGTSMMCMHRALEQRGLDRVRLFGFDSFEGLPDAARDDDGGLWMPGQFNSDYDMTRQIMTTRGADWNRIVLVEGWFDETLNDEFIKEHRICKAGVILVDCDMYSSAKTALTFCAPLIRDEAIILFDDWNAFRGHLAEQNMGEKRAFDEFLQEHPELIADERSPYNENSKVFLVRRTKRDDVP